MCKKKPGPRCSHDTLVLLQRRENEYMAASKTDSDYLEKQNAFNVARRAYKATPDGLEELSEKLKEARKSEKPYFKPVFDSASATTFYDGLIEADVINAEFQVVASHREWQTNAVSSLDKYEESMGSKMARGLARGMLSDLEEQTEKLVANKLDTKALLKKRQEKIRETVIRASEKGVMGEIRLPYEEGVRMRKEILDHHTREHMIAYNQQKISDLKSYIKDQDKKVAALKPAKPAKKPGFKDMFLQMMSK